MRLLLLLLLLLAACRAPARGPAPGEPTPREAASDAAVVEVDPALGCVREGGTDVDACDPSCHVGAPLWCSGMGAPEPADWDHQPCACICEEDELRCASVP